MDNYHVKRTNKKINHTISILITIIFVCLLSSCSARRTLLFLNWGEYINDELVEKFEKLYNCNVVIDLAESNELFYAKLKSGTTAYDLTCPSDYMIEKMYVKDLLQPIDFTQLSNYDFSAFVSPLQELCIDMDKSYPGVNNYHIPYFWGSFGILYNKNKTELETILKEKEWAAIFDKTTVTDTTKVGIYNVPRFVYGAAMIYNNISPNSYTNENLKIFEQTLQARKFNEWGTDTLKKGIESGNLDLAFAYTGDCLDMIYLKIEDGVALEDMSFDVYIPSNTILHMDSLVIPKNARNVDLAYKFINFMLDPENAYLNSTVVGYCTPLLTTYEMIVNYYGYEEADEDEKFWLKNFGDTVAKYYPRDDEGNFLVSGTPLTYFSKEDLTIIENIINNAKAS